ncbi:hypothetical protein SAMN05444695_10631 [Rhodococcus triatomae]|uniref:Uncharacterized protein n=1 Tax=Rhodococcus triatomae TaxID=300028 RepID=A0A1G8J162_9NOCA|nr:hypothetical protein SAMN05444695_10631 [Rhodococcus triatomae]
MQHWGQIPSLNEGQLPKELRRCGLYGLNPARLGGLNEGQLPKELRLGTVVGLGAALDGLNEGQLPKELRLDPVRCLIATRTEVPQ